MQPQGSCGCSWPSHRQLKQPYGASEAPIRYRCHKRWYSVRSGLADPEPLNRIGPGTQLTAVRVCSARRTRRARERERSLAGDRRPSPRQPASPTAPNRHHHLHRNSPGRSLRRLFILLLLVPVARSAAEFLQTRPVRESVSALCGCFAIVPSPFSLTSWPT